VLSLETGDQVAPFRALTAGDPHATKPVHATAPAVRRAKALVDYRRTIDGALAAGLEFWLVQTPNLTPPQSIAAMPWKERNPYPVWKHVRLDDPAEAAAYFAHRRAMMKIVNSADAYVTIDGDPGGYPGARPEEWLSVFLADRAAIDAHGTAPTKQRVIPWVWCGWGTDSVWVLRPAALRAGTALREAR